MWVVLQGYRAYSAGRAAGHRGVNYYRRGGNSGEKISFPPKKSHVLYGPP